MAETASDIPAAGARSQATKRECIRPVRTVDAVAVGAAEAPDNSEAPIVTQLQSAWASRVLEGAFAPFTCVTRDADHFAKLLFAVYDGDRKLIDAHLTEDQAADRGTLEAVVHGARDKLERDGHRLAEWTFPELARGGEA